MKKIVLRFVAAFGFTLALAVVIVISIRIFSDGPVEILPGGPMSGSMALESFPGFSDQPSDFIELQVEAWHPSSRTVIGFFHNGDLYIPSVRAGSKWWPQRVLEKPEVIVRYGGILYPNRAYRITDSTLIPQLRDTVAKAETLVSAQEMFMEDTTWFFRLEPIAE